MHDACARPLQPGAAMNRRNSSPGLDAERFVRGIADARMAPIGRALERLA